MNTDVVPAHLLNHRFKTSSFPVQEDDTLARTHSKDPGHVFGLSTGYRKRAVGAGGDLVNEKTSHQEVPKVGKTSDKKRVTSDKKDITRLL
jgi:hypothetical protein